MKDRFQNIRYKAFEAFSNSINDEVVIVKPSSKANFREASDFIEIWEVKTGLYDNSMSVWLVEDLTIYIAFKADFPLETPKIFYDQDDFEKLGHIPHSSYLRNDVCVFDDFVVVDDHNPVGVIQFQYQKAKEILIKGIKGENELDFEDEFIAYWGTSTNRQDGHLSNMYSLINKKPINFNDLAILFYSLNSKDESDEYSGGIIYNKEENEIDSYKKYFQEYKIDFKEFDAFYIGEKKQISKPPFGIKFGESLNYIDKNLHPAFKSYFNQSGVTKFIVFKKVIQSAPYYLGWHYPKIETNINGFRADKLTKYNAAFGKLMPNSSKYVTRISSEQLNEASLIRRTASDSLPQAEYKFLVAGIGSVGSHLTALLNNFNNPEFVLIDTENLDSENIKRHFLGFKFLGVNKGVALKHFLKDKIPSQKISTASDSVFDYYNENKVLFNDQDFIFLCLGKLNLEKWLIEELRTKELKKPLFIFWVEPYLIGGQLLFIHPDDVPDIEELFTEIFKYRFSVISHEEFEKKRELFTLKESGCQSTFSPYSSSHLSLFLASTQKEIFSIIENKSTQSVYFSWIGDLRVANKLGVKLREDYVDNYTLIKNRL